MVLPALAWHAVSMPRTTPMWPDLDAEPPSLSSEEAQAVRRAWAILLPDADDIADRISAQLLAARSESATRPPDYAADVRRTTREHIRLGLRTMAGTPPEGERTVELWRALARRRARQGVPLEELLASYTTGCRVLWSSLLAVDPRNRSAERQRIVALAGHELWSALEVQNAVLVQAYRLESRRLRRLDDGRRASAMDGLLLGRGSDPAFAREAGEHLGLRPEEPLLVVVGELHGNADPPLRAPEDAVEPFGVRSQWRIRGGHQVGLVAPGALPVTEVLSRLTATLVAPAAWMHVRTGFTDVAGAYHLTVRAVDTLSAQVDGDKALVSTTARLPELLLASSPEVTSLVVEEVLGGLSALPDSARDVLVDTLAAYLEADLSPTHAATALMCHRNTVIYRMKQIVELLKHDPHDNRDRVLLTLALLAYRRSPDTAG